MKERGVRVKESIINVKNYIIAIPRKKKIIIGAVALAIIIFAIGLTYRLNTTRVEYQVLIPGLTNQVEKGEVYSILANMGADMKMNADGDIMVQTQEYDMWLLTITAKGYPKSVLNNDIFTSHAGLTTTESERKTYLLMNLQARLEDTLKKMDGIIDAVVTINLPETGKSVWETAMEEQKSTASVLITGKEGVVFTPEQVSTIKNLVAGGTPMLAPEDVVVTDSKTMMEIFGDSEQDPNPTYDDKYLEYTRKVQEDIEAQVFRALEPIYGAEGVVAVANATLNFDAMMEERYLLQPKVGPDGITTGEGFTTIFDTAGSTNGSGTLGGGLVGEEDNTDIPGYVYVPSTQDGGGTGYSSHQEIDWGYIQTQVEKKSAVLSALSISVLVNEPNLTPQTQQVLTNIVRNATNIQTIDLITIAPFVIPDAIPTPAPTPTPELVTEPFKMPLWGWIVLGVVLLLIIVLIVVILVIRRKRKRDLLLLEAKDAEIEDNMQTMEDEIAKYKRELENAARAASDPKDDAIMDEVRSFAKENPEITANLLRTWLKDGED